MEKKKEREKKKVWERIMYEREKGKEKEKKEK